MKTHFALLFCVVAALHLNALAGGEHEGDHQGDCQIAGSEVLVANIVLAPTTNAPDGATGVALIESDNEDGQVEAELTLTTSGLAAGDYDLTVIRGSDGSSVDLGQIRVSADDNENDCECHHSGDGGDGEQEDSMQALIKPLHEDDGGDDDHADCTNAAPAVLTSKDEVELPADLNAADIVEIVLSDADGVPILDGSVTNPASGSTVSFQACVQVAGAEGAPGCQGMAQVKSTIKKGKKSNHFTLLANGVPPGQTFQVQVNGQITGAAKSNRKGKLLVKKLPANLLSVRSVTLMDSQGHTAMHARF